MRAVFTYDENGKIHMVNVTVIDSRGSEEVMKKANSKITEALRELGCIPVYSTAEEKVKAERRSLHLSQDYVAGYLNMAPWRYAYIESGKDKFSNKDLALLEKLFMVDLK